MIKGESIQLRLIREGDLEEVYNYHADLANRGEFFPLGVLSEPAFKQRYQQDGFWGKDDGMLLIVDREDQIVGHIEFFATVPYLDEYELSYQLYARDQYGKGYTTEAVKLLVDYLFGRKKINRIRLVIHPDNAASRRVAEKCGFTHEGTARGAWFHQGKNHDVEIYSLLRGEV